MKKIMVYLLLMTMLIPSCSVALASGDEVVQFLEEDSAYENTNVEEETFEQFVPEELNDFTLSEGESPWVELQGNQNEYEASQIDTVDDFSFEANQEESNLIDYTLSVAENSLFTKGYVCVIKNTVPAYKTNEISEKLCDILFSCVMYVEQIENIGNQKFGKGYVATENGIHTVWVNANDMRPLSELEEQAYLDGIRYPQYAGEAYNIKIETEEIEGISAEGQPQNDIIETEEESTLKIEENLETEIEIVMNPYSILRVGENAKGLEYEEQTIEAPEKDTLSVQPVSINITLAHEDDVYPINMYVGDQCSLITRVEGTEESEIYTIEYGSSDEEIASVDDDGNVFAHMEGEVTIHGRLYINNEIIDVSSVEVHCTANDVSAGINIMEDVETKQIITAQAMSANVKLADFSNVAYIHTSRGGLNRFELAYQCTWYCYGRAIEKLGVVIPFDKAGGLNANVWLERVRGLEVSYDPNAIRGNSIAVSKAGTYGHVMFVEEVNGDTVVFSEANWADGVPDGYSKERSKSQFISGRNIAGYIYLSGSTQPSVPSSDPRIIFVHAKTPTVTAGDTAMIYAKTNEAVEKVLLFNERGEEVGGAHVPTTNRNGEKEWDFGWQTRDAGVRHVELRAYVGGKYASYALTIQVVDGGSSAGQPRFVYASAKQSQVISGETVMIYAKTNDVVDKVLLYNERNEEAGGSHVPTTNKNGEKEWDFGWQTRDVGDRVLKLRAYSGSNYVEYTIYVTVTGISSGEGPNIIYANAKQLEVPTGETVMIYAKTNDVVTYVTLTDEAGREIARQETPTTQHNGEKEWDFGWQTSGLGNQALKVCAYANGGKSEYRINVLLYEPKPAPQPQIVVGYPRVNTVLNGSVSHFFAWTNDVVDKIELLDSSKNILTTCIDGTTNADRSKYWNFDWTPPAVGDYSFFMKAYSGDVSIEFQVTIPLHVISNEINQMGNLFWQFDPTSGVLSIWGNGEMPGDNNPGDVPWAILRQQIKEVYINPGIRSIMNYAFDNCTNLSIVEIADSVQKIGVQAFSGCNSLQIISLPQGIERIEAGLFMNSKSLKSIVIPEGVTSIGGSAFSGCSSLELVTLPGTISDFTNSYVFYNCTSLESINIPEGISRIGYDYFNGCSSLKKVVFPSSMRQIDQNAFMNCTSLFRCEFKGNAPRIMRNAFLRTKDDLTFFYVNGASGFTTPVWEGVPCYPLNSNGGIVSFVDRLYTMVLNRDAENEGIKHWHDELVSGSVSGAQACSQFFFSGEFLLRNTSNDTFVDLLYQVCMDRKATADERAYWVNYLQQGCTRLFVLNEFVNSQEYKNICDSYNINRGALSGLGYEDIHYKVVMFVSRMYTIVLNRPAEADGIRHWTRLLVTGAVSGREMAAGFVYSREFEIRNVSNAEYIRTMYHALLNRACDQAELNHWLSRVEREGRNILFDGFSQSQEFSLLLSQYGIS